LAEERLDGVAGGLIATELADHTVQFVGRGIVGEFGREFRWR
jgi:hypothetical protein